MCGKNWLGWRNDWNRLISFKKFMCSDIFNQIPFFRVEFIWFKFKFGYFLNGFVVLEIFCFYKYIINTKCRKFHWEIEKQIYRKIFSIFMRLIQELLWKKLKSIFATIWMIWPIWLCFSGKSHTNLWIYFDFIKIYSIDPKWFVFGQQVSSSIPSES